MTVGPYLNSYLPVSRASDALRNQAETILSELHASIDRAHAFRAKLAKRAEDRAPSVWIGGIETPMKWGVAPTYADISRRDWAV